MKKYRYVVVASSRKAKDRLVITAGTSGRTYERRKTLVSLGGNGDVRQFMTCDEAVNTRDSKQVLWGHLYTYKIFRVEQVK